ncbi:MAG: VOC family protein [Acidimicrobiales bacterium]|nr:VOC family protein [Acidimicrobiales bacterium]
MLERATFVGFIPVRDLDTARAFYCDMLDLPFVEQDSVAVVVRVGDASLRLTEVADPQPREFTVAGWQVEDVSPIVTSLAQRGAQVKRYEGMGQDAQGIWTSPSGEQVAWFTDPDGNVLSITSRARDR